MPDAIAAGQTTTEVARAAGISRTAVHQWKVDDPAFARDYDAAFDAGTDVYEAEARRRAFAGMSDTLLIFLMKCRHPERFNRKMLDVAVGGSVQHQIGGAHQHQIGEGAYVVIPDNGRGIPAEAQSATITTDAIAQLSGGNYAIIEGDVVAIAAGGGCLSSTHYLPPTTIWRRQK